MAPSGERRWRRDVPPDYTVRSIELGARLLDLLIEHPGGLSLDQLTRAVGRSKTTVYRALATQAMRGHIDPVSADRYRLGPRLLLPQKTHLDLLVLRAHPHLEALSQRFAYTVSLGVLDPAAVTVVDTTHGRSALQAPVEPGLRLPLHASALGKVLAATLDDEEVGAVVRLVGMPARTARTITDPDVLVAELARIRRRGWAIDDREYDDVLRGVAAAVPGRRVVAGLALTGPAEGLPLDELDRMAPLLRDHAEHVLLPGDDRD